MMTQCANCYAITECLDDGEAYICADRVACQYRANAVECATCDGKGGELEFDLEGDDAWAITVIRIGRCPDCIGSGRCPGCGTPMTPEQQATAERDIESFTCAIDACSWHYNVDRFYDYDEPDYADY